MDEVLTTMCPRTVQACFINDMLFITWFLLEISYCSYQNSHEKDWIAQDNPHLVLHS